MIIAYLMPREANDPRDGLGFLTTAETKLEASHKLRAQIEDAYADELSAIEWVVGNPEHRDHCVLHFKDGMSEFYWFHEAEA